MTIVIPSPKCHACKSRIDAAKYFLRTTILCRHQTRLGCKKSDSAGRRQPVNRVQYPDDCEGTGDEAEEGGYGRGYADDAEGVGGDGGIAGVD